MKSLSKYPVPFCCFHCPTIFSSLGSLILGEQIVHIDESEDQLSLSNNKPSFKLTRVPLLLLHNSVFFAAPSFFDFPLSTKTTTTASRTTFSLFFSGPPPLSPHYCCFPTTTIFLLFSPFLLHHHHHHHHHHIPMRISTTTTTFQCVF